MIKSSSFYRPFSCNFYSQPLQVDLGQATSDVTSGTVLKQSREVWLSFECCQNISWPATMGPLFLVLLSSYHYVRSHKVNSTSIVYSFFEKIEITIFQWKWPSVLYSTWKIVLLIVNPENHVVNNYLLWAPGTLSLSYTLMAICWASTASCTYKYKHTVSTPISILGSHYATKGCNLN